MSKFIEHDHSNDGVDRRGFLKCMAWTGTGLLWTMSGGVPKSFALGKVAELTESQRKSLFFAQISDSHIGFSKAANQDVTATLQAAVDKLNLLPQTPAFVLHTGDISQLSKADEFDTADQVLRGIKADRVFYVPGEHDVLTDNGAQYLQRYGKSAKGAGWYSFDHSGVHFIGLVNVLNLKAGGLGSLGVDQLDWLKRDVTPLSASTPIVVFAHIPLWSVYPQWGWGTDDSEQALSLLKRFGSVTVLNGHIHQTMQKIEGNVAFHTALSTAFPQPAPGTAPSPGPMTVDAARLRSFLGVRHVTYVEGRSMLATVDSTISGEPPGDFAMGHDMAASPRKAKPALALAANQIGIDNFSFTPRTLTVRRGTTVTWINSDDVPHVIVSTRQKFPGSKVIDTNQRYSYTFDTAGAYDYFCAIHPIMTGTIVVQ
jgi:3',5'-cyclic-AMP phosphodiesterase